MKNIKQQFNEFRTNTPKHVQWLLLGAAFVIVVILLTLVLAHRSNNQNTIANANIPTEFKIEPKSIDLTNVEVGSYKNAHVNISVNTPIVIKSINVPENTIRPTHNCDGVIESCRINLIYRPKFATEESTATLTVIWHLESQPEISNEAEVSIVYSSWAKEEKPVVKPEPIIENMPVQKPEPVMEPVMVQTPAVVEVREVASPNPFTEPKEEKTVLTPEKCSDFAIPGYDQSGRQIGWIKPEHGANYFHPFSDKDCSNPTGIYDFSTGVITSLSDGSKIGTDSDHIGYRNVRSRNLSVPQLSSPRTSASTASNGEFEDAVWLSEGDRVLIGKGTFKKLSSDWVDYDARTFRGSSSDDESVISSRPYDRTFILRQFKPIPATIVSEVRADPSVYGCKGIASGKCDPDKNYSIPVRATVDRNVYSDDGRTIILPTGTLLLGYLDGELPGPYQAFGRMNIKWYQFIRPDGVEFNFKADQDPYSGDAQGRMGVPGHGSTDYMEQMVMPILTALVPAAVNMIAPIADTVINQIDLDNNTIVQSGTIRSSEMAKQDIINTWNKITQKLLVDAIDNTVPPFSIAAGTRINVFSPVDLIVTCGRDGLQDDDTAITKKCQFVAYSKTERREWSKLKKNVEIDKEDSSWIGQVRSFDLMQYCTTDANGKITIGSNWTESGSDYRTVLMYCESQNYQAKNNAKQAAYNQNLQQQSQDKYGSVTFNQTTGTFQQSGTDEQVKAYNTEVLGLTYDDEGNITNPFAKPAQPFIEDVLTCDDGNAPDANGCCAGETYTDMGDAGFNCCPDSGGDCFPPIEVQ